MSELYKSYDRIADQYDEHYTTPDDVQENREIQAMLREIITPDSTVFDIGCGTGLTLDLIDIHPDNYYGIDPSQAMLDKFKEKHPHHTVDRKTYEETDEPHVDVALAIFAGHYIADDHKERLVTQADRYLYMFAKPDYAPSWYYTEEEQEESRHMTDYKRLLGMFALTDWHNYWIAYKK